MCDCRTRIEHLLTCQMMEETPDAKEHSAHLMGYGIYLSGGECIYMPVELRSTVTSKKTGATRRKVEKTDFHFSYCPFCGEKIAAK